MLIVVILVLSLAIGAVAVGLYLLTPAGRVLLQERRTRQVSPRSTPRPNGESSRGHETSGEGPSV